jgi:peptidoglycan/xylan/chitin deacetylase (PgdA/CDA1 family)
MTGLSTKLISRAQIKALWAGLLRATGVLYMARKWVQKHGIIILTFHRVLSDEELQSTMSLPGMIVRRKTFGSFLRYAAENCEYVDLSRRPEWKSNNKLKLAITFDDGWCDNATTAYPVARAHQAPIVIFIVSGKMGMELPFWPERVAAILKQKYSAADALQWQKRLQKAIEELKQLPAAQREQRIIEMSSGLGLQESSAAVDRTMTWEQITELHSGGITFGSHTRTHEILTTLAAEQAQDEITVSREVIENKLPAPCTLFSYPNGNYSAEIRSMAEGAGYQYAFTNQIPGVWTRDCDPFLVPRVNVCETDMVDTKGNFSPLIFSYTVVWSAAKGLMTQMSAVHLGRVNCIWKSCSARIAAWFVIRPTAKSS